MKQLVRNILSIVVALIFLFQFPQLVSVYAGNPPDSGQSIVQASTGTVTANGQSTFAITITLKDSSGAIITGDTVSITSSDGTAIISPSSKVLDGAGQATFTMASNNPGTDKISITDTTTITTITRDDWVITFAPTPTSTLTPTPIGGCYDAAPGSTPQLTSAVSAGAHGITLTWSAASTPVTYYLISYGTTSGSYIYGNPNVGNITSYTVSALTTGKTYYFVVKAINGCMAGSYSNEVPAVAGASSSSPTPTSTGSSPAAADEVTGQDINNQISTDTPSSTPGPPITPVPPSGSVNPMRIVMYLLGVAIVLIAIAIFVWWRMSKKDKEENTIEIPQQPESVEPPEPTSL